MLITLLKLAFKQALLGGRVYRLPEYADPVTPGALSFDTDFSAYHRPLSPQLWAAFQDSERAFRAGLNTGPRREKCFACSGDPGEWIRLIKAGPTRKQPAPGTTRKQPAPGTTPQAARCLTELSHSESSKASIVPFPPGHFETFDLKPTGKVQLLQMARFHCHQRVIVV
ncbi:unnamed protein product [Arctogadus glacialis]